MQQIFKGMDNGASAIQANFDEITSPTANKTVNDLTVKGKFSLSSQPVITNNFKMGNMSVGATRVMNNVILYFDGTLPGNDWNAGNVNPIPLGYRPITSFLTDLSDNNGYAKVGFNNDGTMYRRGSNNFGTDVHHAIAFPTNDSWPV